MDSSEALSSILHQVPNDDGSTTVVPQMDLDLVGELFRSLRYEEGEELTILRAFNGVEYSISVIREEWHLSIGISDLLLHTTRVWDWHWILNTWVLRQARHPSPERFFADGRRILVQETFNQEETIYNLTDELLVYASAQAGYRLLGWLEIPQVIKDAINRARAVENPRNRNSDTWYNRRRRLVSRDVLGEWTLNIAPHIREVLNGQSVSDDEDSAERIGSIIDLEDPALAARMARRRSNPERREARERRQREREERERVRRSELLGQNLERLGRESAEAIDERIRETFEEMTHPEPTISAAATIGVEDLRRAVDTLRRNDERNEEPLMPPGQWILSGAWNELENGPWGDAHYYSIGGQIYGQPRTDLHFDRNRGLRSPEPVHLPQLRTRPAGAELFRALLRNIQANDFQTQNIEENEDGGSFWYRTPSIGRNWVTLTIDGSQVYRNGQEIDDERIELLLTHRQGEMVYGGEVGELSEVRFMRTSREGIEDFDNHEEVRPMPGYEVLEGLANAIEKSKNTVKE